VFDDYPSMKKAVDDPDLDVTADHVLILRNAGPQGGPGMPEWGMLPIPTKLVKQGVRDMVRLSDARMSGTSYGACILHVSPESFIGGPLALVRNGDRITLDVAARTIDLDVPEAELAVNAARSGSSPRSASSAAMAGCSRSTSSRPMRAATSISSRPGLASRWASRRFTSPCRSGAREA
jgi:dihydroxyacid dehydratase/phosphogluconate dehydratase